MLEKCPYCGKEAFPTDEPGVYFCIHCNKPFGNDVLQTLKDIMKC
jgi:DNA-directed RNA polymerase subunit RPC12/RpoP